MTNDIIASAARTAPPVSVVGAYLVGVHVSDLVMVATLIYTVLQIFVLVRDKVVRK